DDRTLDLLWRELSARAIDAPAVEGALAPAPNGRTFVRPELVINVRYTGFTDDGHLRHPVFTGLRADVSPGECTAGPEPLPAEPEPPAGSQHEHEQDHEQASSVRGRETAAKPAPRAKSGPRQVKISNPNKVFWPSEGYTKSDLCAYYEAMAPQILPFLRSRPVILVRYPDGIEGKSFYQWNAPQGTPSWVKTVRVRWETRNDKEVDLFLVDDVETLVHIANLGCIPLHILAARVQDLAACDFLTVDFDLSGGTFAHAITLARALLALLERIGLRSYPKTSGQSGLHVLVPLGPGVGFDTAVALADLLGKLIAGQHADIATTERRKEKRGSSPRAPTTIAWRRWIVWPSTASACAAAASSAWERPSTTAAACCAS
ncbi:MAG TPA: hypothetical protein VFZ61_30355, partial [Polyangiales bacterium]